MKILFAYPDYQHRDTSPPLGLLYVASVLEQQGHMVQIIDFSVDKRSNFSAAIRASDIFGISFTSQQFQEAHKLITQVRRLSEGIKILVGGPHATIYEKAVFEVLPSIDYVVVGEGEYVALDLITGVHPEKVKGLMEKSLDGYPD